jgi:hypothetical protein
MRSELRLRAGLAALAAALCCTPAAAEERVGDRIAVIVNDDVISLSELYDYAGDVIEQECLPPAVTPCLREVLGEAAETLVRRLLERQELQRLDADVTPDEMDRTLKQLLREYDLPDREALRQEVESTGMAWDVYLRFQVEDFVREQKFNGMVLRSRVTISDDDLKDQYQRLVRELGQVDAVRLEAFGLPLPPDPDVRVKLVEEVAAALSDVRAGRRTFDEVAATYDEARVGPMLRGHQFRKEELNEEMSGVVFALPEGGVADPLIANGVLYGLTVVSKEKAKVDVPPFEAVKDQLADQVFQLRIEQAMEEWYEGAKRRAAIRWLIDVVHPTSDPGAPQSTAAGAAGP